MNALALSLGAPCSGLLDIGQKYAPPTSAQSSTTKAPVRRPLPALPDGLGADLVALGAGAGAAAGGAGGSASVAAAVGAFAGDFFGDFAGGDLAGRDGAGDLEGRPAEVARSGAGDLRAGDALREGGIE